MLHFAYSFAHVEKTPLSYLKPQIRSSTNGYTSLAIYSSSLIWNGICTQVDRLISVLSAADR